MLRAPEGLCRPVLLLLLLLLLCSLGPAHLEEVRVEVIVDSSPCSATCGLGLRTQTLCWSNHSGTAVDESLGREDGTEVKGSSSVSEACRVQKVKCREAWQCGLSTMTVTSGQRVEADCLGEVMEAMGTLSWRVSWRYARGVITSDNSLFARWEVPQLGRLVLNPVREADAGTYRCDVLDAHFHRVKRVYWGVRVLPAGILSLDF